MNRWFERTQQVADFRELATKARVAADVALTYEQGGWPATPAIREEWMRVLTEIAVDYALAAEQTSGDMRVMLRCFGPGSKELPQGDAS